MLVFVVDLILPEILTFGGVTTGFVSFFGVAALVATGAAYIRKVNEPDDGRYSAFPD